MQLQVSRKMFDHITPSASRFGESFKILFRYVHIESIRISNRETFILKNNDATSCHPSLENKAELGVTFFNYFLRIIE